MHECGVREEGRRGGRGCEAQAKRCAEESVDGRPSLRKAFSCNGAITGENAAVDPALECGIKTAGPDGIC